jgi:hypothetical protein
MKYIFVTGAPGSKWSSVAKNIYYSPSVDRSDYSESRTYYRTLESGKQDLLHMGAYWDPGMEFGKFFDKINCYSKEQCEAEFNGPFAPERAGVRIIKSHSFANHVGFLKQYWSDCAVVLVHRSDDACLGWWVKCGQFDIPYPDYREYYKDFKEIARLISYQNQGIADAIYQATNQQNISTNQQLAQVLGLALPPSTYAQDYVEQDIRVTVI